MKETINKRPDMSVSITQGVFLLFQVPTIPDAFEFGNFYSTQDGKSEVVIQDLDGNGRREFFAAAEPRRI